MFSTLNVRALGWAVFATLLLLVAVLAGSRNLQNFDGALIAYLFGTVFAFFGIVYRYAVWLQRPPTRRYWVRSWQLFFSRRLLAYAWEGSKRLTGDVLAQSFIFRRDPRRGIAHVLLAWGCLSAFAVTIPLTFGWINFTLKEGTITVYETHLFGFKAGEFPLDSFLAFGLFHALNFSSLAVIIGAAFFLHRRMTNAGQVATQTYEMDWMPLVLLILVAVTGLGLTFDYEFMQGKAHPFMAIAHAVAVIIFLVWLPFGKFFHVVQRPAQIGVALYRREGEAGPQAICPHTGQSFASQMHIDDLKQVTSELGFNFDLEGGGSHLDLSPQGKRAALARAHLKAREQSGSLFG